MLNTLKIHYTGLLLAVFVFAGCGLAADNKEAREISGKLYEALKAGDAATAASYCGTDETMTTDAWKDLFAQNINTMGKVVSYDTEGGFNVSQSGGNSTVLVSYEVTYEYGKSKDSLSIINMGDGFKIYRYAPVIVEARFQEEMTKAKALVTSYLQAIQSGDYTKALSYVGYSGSEKHTVDEWNDFYALVESSAGRITSIEIHNDLSLAYLNDVHEEAGTGNIYAIAATTMHGDVGVSNQVDVFQPKFGGELKIIAHNVK